MFKSFSHAPFIGLVFLLTVISLLFWIDVGSGSDEIPAKPTRVTITGAENHSIALAQGAQLTKNFRLTALPNVLHAEMFGRDAILGLLSQQECVGLRIYVGRKENGAQVFVLVGVNPQGMDLTGEKVVENGWPCPPICDGSSALAADAPPLP
jgi:hypothetical protein